MNLLGPIEAAASPYLFWIKLAGAVVLASAIAGGGWYARGVIEKPKVLTAQLQTANCQSAGETARADSNAAAAGGLQSSIDLASNADSAAIAQLGKIAIASHDIMESVNAQPNGKALGSNPSLRAYLDGLRRQPAAAP